MEKNYHVQVKEIDTEVVVKTMGLMSKVKAQKVLLGLDIQLNHDRYEACMVEAEEEDQG